jgi:hypothetical protein
MKNKNLLIGGTIAVVLLLLLLRKKPTATIEDEEKRGGGGGGDAGLGGGGGGAMAQENGGGAIMQTGQPIVVAPLYSPNVTYQSSPPDNVNNTLRPLPITPPAVSTRPLFSTRPSVSTRPLFTRTDTAPATKEVSANINKTDSNSSTLRNFSTFNGMADGKINGLDFGGDLD